MAQAVRALRGATTVDEDTPEQVRSRTVALLTQMLEANGVHHDDIISVWFTATDDIHSIFPATGARKAGLGDVPLICARELDIDGGQPLCIRVLVHLYTERSRPELHHVYLEGAKSLRDDLPELTGDQHDPAARNVIVGTGLIGGSIGLALRAQGWHVSGSDVDEARAARAVELAAFDAVGLDATAEITFVATPVGAVRADGGRPPWPRARARHRRGQREGVGRRRSWPTRASWAATRWPARSRRASTVPTRRSSPAPCGC